VPFFSQVDEQLLDAICERLVGCGKQGAAGGDGAEDGGGHADLGATFLASKFAENTKRGAAQHQHKRIDDVSTIKFPKPNETDFSLHTDDVL
jgi:cyclic nucleotide gated channel, plant